MQSYSWSAGTKRVWVGAAVAAAALCAGSAQAALQDRDLNGDTVVDAFYDTDLNITWLRDANVNGYMVWGEAVNWADGYSFGGYSDWRLPTSDVCWGYSCIGSEMGHLWYVELGNPAGGPLTNTGDFQNMQSNHYWSGTEYVPNPCCAWDFNFADGVQNTPNKVHDPFLAMAVRDGDVPSIPEPETYALMLAGLAGLALVSKAPLAAVSIRRHPGSTRSGRPAPMPATGSRSRPQQARRPMVVRDSRDRPGPSAARWPACWL